MGIPAPSGVAAAGTPPTGDQANAVLSGSITAVGPTAPFAFRGPMNIALWRAITTTLTTTAGSAAATVADATGLAVGDAINSTNVPRGTTIGALAGTDVTLAFPPGKTAADVLGGADTAASFTGAAISFTGTVNVERSFDGAATWLLCNIGGAGAVAQYTAGPVSLTFGEPEKQVLYRLNCIAFTTGPINYRISQTGGAAESLAIGALI